MNTTITLLEIMFPVITDRLNYLVLFAVGSIIALPCWIYVLYKKCHATTDNVIIV